MSLKDSVSPAFEHAFVEFEKFTAALTNCGEQATAAVDATNATTAEGVAKQVNELFSPYAEFFPPYQTRALALQAALESMVTRRISDYVDSPVAEVESNIGIPDFETALLPAVDEKVRVRLIMRKVLTKVDRHEKVEPIA